MELVLSVVIPVYNCEKYVERAAQSVLNQPCAEHIELLLIDDGSKDKSGEILDRIADEYENVRVFHKENGGVSSARNLGIENAKGKYLAFLDSDDWWEQNFFDQQLLAEINSAQSVDIYDFAWSKISKNLDFRKDYSKQNSEHRTDEFGTIKLNAVPFCVKLYRRTLIEKYLIRFPNSKIGEDVSFAEVAIYYATSAKQINRMLLYYFQHNDSCIHASNKTDYYLEKKKSVIYKYEKINSSADDMDREIKSVLTSLLPDWCAYNSYRFVRDYTQSDACSVLRDENVKPWSALQKSLDLWKKHPRLFWLKSKIHPGIAYAIKRFCYSVPFLRRPVDYMFHRFILRWQKAK